MIGVYTMRHGDELEILGPVKLKFLHPRQRLGRATVGRRITVVAANRDMVRLVRPERPAIDSSQA